MRRWMQAVGLGAAAAMFGVAVVMQACNGQQSHDRMMGMSPSRAERNGDAQGQPTLRQVSPGTPSDGPSGQWSPPAFSPGSLGLATTTAAPTGVEGNGWIDFQQALQANQGGGGGQSPFDSSGLSGSIRMRAGLAPGDPVRTGSRESGLPWTSLFGRRSARTPSEPPDPNDATVGFQNYPTRVDQLASTAGAQRKLIEAYQREVEALRREEAASPRTAEFILRPGEELWVIERRKAAVPTGLDDRPGCGSLMTQVRERPPAGAQGPDNDGPWQTVPVPLKHTGVQSWIDGYIGTVSVKQEFVNPYSEKIEAVYVFPLPENAAVNEFLMTIGDRTIRGIIREREEAEQIYSEARRQGHTASLLTQERPNIFTQHVANIEPGKQIDIEMRYFHTLAYRDGWFEWAFPMVVGPRFNPPCTTDGVGAVARGQYGASGQATEVQYLRPGERSGHDISVRVSLDAGVPIESIECKTHQVRVAADRGTSNRAEVELSSLDSIPNKDFVLRYRIAGRDVKSAMLTQRTERGGFFSLMLVPPADLEYIDRGPMEMVFVIDCSGSMQGEPIDQAKRAVEHALQGLDRDDTFQVINFAESASQFGARPIPASYENVRRGLDYVRSLNANGGTMMINGLRASLGFPHDPRRLRFVCFLTDGYIGNEAEILGELRKGLDESRIFSMGIGSSVNRYLLEEMAKMGRGVAGFIGPGDDAADVMDKFLHRVSHAALCNLRIDWGDMEVADVYPKQFPDLFVGRPVILTGRYKGSGATTVKVSGRAGRERLPITVPVSMTGRDGRGIEPVWARARLGELGEQVIAYPGSETYPRQVRETALSYGLMSAYTSFVAVDSLTRTAGRMGTTVEVAVPTPEGVKYESTVPERAARRTPRQPGDDHP